MKKLSLEELNRISVSEFKEVQKNPIVLILDDVRSMHNVGSAFRTADAFRIEKIYLCGITGTPPHREIEKTALGATESVIWEHRTDILSLIEELQSQDYFVWAVEQAEGSTKLQDWGLNLQEKQAFIFGNEVFGVKQEAIEKANACLEIPQFGTKHSLNVSVSLGIVVWEATKRVMSYKIKPIADCR